MERISLEKERLGRLRRSPCVLGEPDLLSQHRITTVSSFLTQKKNVDSSEHFISGLNFSTTAHFSFFVNQRIREWGRDSKHDTAFRMKLSMYDAFRKVDVQIEISIPGSLEIKGFGLNGQPIKVSEKDYQGAYFSSILRSLWTNYFHPSLQLYPDLHSYEVLTGFIKSYIPFAMANPLPLEEGPSEEQNMGIQILLEYLKQNRLINLATYACQVLKEYMPQRAYFLTLELLQIQEDYQGIVVETASKMLDDCSDPNLNYKLKQFQLRSLVKLQKRQEIKHLTENLIREGLEDIKTWEVILASYIDREDDQEFMKLLNTAVNFVGEDMTSKQEKLKKLSMPVAAPQPKEDIDKKKNKSSKISDYPEFMFQFGEDFLDKESRLKYYREVLEKSDKEKLTLELLTRFEVSRAKQICFQRLVMTYEKQKSWNKLLLLRASCFWLENDYASYENSIKKKSSETSYRYLNESFQETEAIANISKIKHERQERAEMTEMNESFDGEFSDAESEAGDKEKSIAAPICSKRVATKRVTKNEAALKKGEPIKILCHFSLEAIFLNVYNDLRLQGDADKWFQKLNFDTMNELSQQKKELLSLVCIKKAYFHLRMMRFRKCEESLKVARKISNSFTSGLISCYALAKLYLQHNNVKGVEFYTIQIVKILWSAGIETYDVLPEWCKEFIPFIIKRHGKGIINRLQGPLNDLVSLWLRIEEPKPKPVSRS